MISSGNGKGKGQRRKNLTLLKTKYIIMSFFDIFKHKSINNLIMSGTSIL